MSHWVESTPKRTAPVPSIKKIMKLCKELTGKSSSNSERPRLFNRVRLNVNGDGIDSVSFNIDRLTTDFYKKILKIAKKYHATVDVQSGSYGGDRRDSMTVFLYWPAEHSDEI